ncbi:MULTISPECIES: hypothetical protein [Clostridium]|uniref:hypothetical protein n=1 Tax=Clostridium TaxID=1485 RepID=UPI00257C843E|nr:MULTISPECIES: hypothetical protein [Clostridium]MBS4840044.1 hypothetical protein [Clostridium sp.]MDU1401199.1 hypothetical protein [Clostridium sp.]MDU1603741.1 hypothetical protein [Clostridium sp.]MDU2895143.1 hypothetical protein [Clostridium sp.]MDU3007418.1 hypothetical protein [Clostridium sp.]
MDTKKLIRTLDAISYETKLGKNLKNTLRKVDKDLLMDELNDYRLFLKKRRRLLDQHTYRIKSLQSIKLKYDRYYPTKEIGTCFNDILGIRIIVLDYDINLSNENIRHVDMSNGNKNDDGYRGYHIYYKKSNFNYPIEVKFFTERDYIFNMWLHKYVYKYKDNMIGIKLKDLYDKGVIQNEDDFKEELEKCIIY